MTDYNDGKWHGWNGGSCPVHPKSEVQVATRDGIFSRSAENWAWDCKYIPTIAFRVVKKFEEPKVIWVNEYEDEIWPHYTKERAENAAKERYALRVAVKYVESCDA